MGVSAPGGMAETVIVPEARAVSLPDNLADDAATVLEPVAVALHLIEKIRDRPGGVLVLGAAPSELPPDCSCSWMVAR